MTTPMMDFQAAIEKADDGDFLRELIGYAAQRLMEFDRQAIDPWDRSQGE